jgi:hypothetical protein
MADAECAKAQVAKASVKTEALKRAGIGAPLSSVSAVDDTAHFDVGPYSAGSIERFLN